MYGGHPRAGMMHLSTTPLSIMHERYVLSLFLYYYQGSCFHKPQDEEPSPRVNKAVIISLLSLWIRDKMVLTIDKGSALVVA